MSATGAKKASNKTAHVMNLISQEDGSAAVEAVQPPAPAAAVIAPPATCLPPLLEAARADDFLSNDIKQALESELESQAEPQPAAPIASAPVAEAAPAPAESPFRSEDDKLTYVNVMQYLVEEKTAGYMNMFDMCRCPRCVADVKAVALTKLPAKYVVMRKGDLVPMRALFEGRYETTITAQIINACKLVMASPRHNMI